MELTSTNCPFGFPPKNTRNIATKQSTQRQLAFICTILVGDHSQEGPPVPIPNTEVKLYGADGTAGVARWESRLSPTIPFSPLSLHAEGAILLDRGRGATSGIGRDTITRRVF